MDASLHVHATNMQKFGECDGMSMQHAACSAVQCSVVSCGFASVCMWWVREQSSVLLLLVAVVVERGVYQHQHNIIILYHQGHSAYQQVFCFCFSSCIVSIPSTESLVNLSWIFRVLLAGALHLFASTSVHVAATPLATLSSSTMKEKKRYFYRLPVFTFYELNSKNWK